MKTSPDAAATATACACALVLALQLAGAPAVLAADTTSAPASAAGTNSSDPASPQADQLQEVVVTGIRADLEKALITKEFAPVVLDSIDSTELGRFPDADVADSLEHLPGITISRTTGGEGEKISVRGLGPEYNIVTLDNRILASDDDGRDIAFDVLPAELITGADVLKSAEASAVEGSIGGTVNLHTASAFDHPGFTRMPTPKATGTTCHGSTAASTLRSSPTPTAIGRSASCSARVYSDLKDRTDSLNAYNQNIYGPTTYPYMPAARVGAARRDALLHHLRLDLRRQEAYRPDRQPGMAPDRQFSPQGRRPVDALERPAGRLQRVLLLRGQPRRHAVREQRRGAERRDHRRLGG